MNTEKLKALALAAMPGNWENHRGIIESETEGFSIAVVRAYFRENEAIQSANADYIAEANPAAMLELIAKLDRAERALLRAGFQDNGAQEWKPPIGKPPIFIDISAPAAGAEKDAALETARDALNAMLEQFTRTPSTLADSRARGHVHAAISIINAVIAARANTEAPSCGSR